MLIVLRRGREGCFVEMAVGDDRRTRGARLERQAGAAGSRMVRGSTSIQTNFTPFFFNAPAETPT
ncbi:MAG: hypothetical protein N2C14_27270, partial [Planctomycetales bacterium]